VGLVTTQTIKLYQISNEAQCRRETFTMIWNVSWESHRMKLHLVKHVTRRISSIEQGQRKKWGKLQIVLGHFRKKTLMLNGMFIPSSNDL
jgi:hypothetical protein